MFISFFAATESFNPLYFFLSRRQLHCVLSDTLAMPPSKEKVRRTFQLEWTTIARRVKLCARSRRPLKQLVRVHLILFFCVWVYNEARRKEASYLLFERVENYLSLILLLQSVSDHCSDKIAQCAEFLARSQKKCRFSREKCFEFFSFVSFAVPTSAILSPTAFRQILEN